MKLLVVSDVHGDLDALERAVDAEADADAVIFLGDGLREAEDLQDMRPELKIYSVRGNCDFGTSATLAGCFSCGPAKIFYTHGHMYSVKYGLDDLVAAAADIEANVVLFGHTHVPFVGYQRGMHLLNPGSLGLPRDGKSTYGVVDVTETDIVFFINELTTSYRTVLAATYRPIEAIVIAGMIYLLVTTVLSQIVELAEWRMRKNERC